ncbi:MAG TPA: SDR family oxidoreductase [Nocardioidaceae bacterium]|nr:SDR family oxidoreductase [Nocardioidaceae bacterium]
MLTPDLGPVVVVTGASAGVGRATARAFAAEGASVALLARGEEGLGATRGEVEMLGGRALAIPLDVADWQAVDDAASLIEAQLGPIDIWINNAFSSIFAPVTETAAAEFRRTTEVTYLGSVYGTLAALHRMRARDRGAIVQVGSALAYRSIPLQAAYCASKHAIQGFTESLRCELLHDGSDVHVTMVQLPAVNTPQFDWTLSRLPQPARPVPPIYQPEVAARAIVHAARQPTRREYWVGGSTTATLLANKFAPGLLDRYLARTSYAAQQSDRLRRHDTPNLWAPADGPTGDQGAHGAFDDVAHPVSRQAALSRHRGRLAAALGLGIGAAAGALLRRRTTSPS